MDRPTATRCPANRCTRSSTHVKIKPAGELKSEFERAGISIIGYVDFQKLFSMWHTYLLRTATD